MQLQLVREQFQSDMIGKDNFKSVEIGKVWPLCCTMIFVIDGIKMLYKYRTKIINSQYAFISCRSYKIHIQYTIAIITFKFL